MRNVIRMMIVLIVTGCPAALAQNKLLTIDDIYDPAKRVGFSGSPPTDLRWLKDGIHYVQRRPDGGGETQLLKVNAATGETTDFYNRTRVEAALKKLAGISAEQARRMSAPESLRLNDAGTAALINHANDLFYYEFGSERAIRLTSDPDVEMNEDFSPDGRMVSFVRRNNLYVVEIAAERERALTSDGSDKILNGVLDWVYQEELYGRGDFKGYWWSPDSSRLAFLRLDERPVHDFTVVDHIPYRQAVEVTPYPKAGDPNPLVQLGVVAAMGGSIHWVDLYPYQGAEILIVRVSWTPNGKKVVYQVQNREQTWLDLNAASLEEGKSETWFRESSKAWIQVIDNPHWLDDGSFLWLSEVSGWQHIYHYGTNGRLIRRITDGKWEVRSLSGVDQSKGWVYFTGTMHSHITTHLYRVPLSGGSISRLSEAQGTHAVSFNRSFTHYLDTASDIATPTQVQVHTAEGRLVRTVYGNKAETLSQYKLGKVEFLQVRTRDGFLMEAMMIKPPDFDASKKYPVMSHTYSGPMAPRVRDSWGGDTYMWHQMLAQKGYIIWICDNRTASSKGLESAWPLYRRFGELELQDLEDGLAWLKRQPYVDGSRIGIWGWSFGGFMTTYALTHSKSFRIGIAGGSVTDWRDYDSIYTERYMATPQNNPEGYKNSAPRSAAKELHGKLLLIHGTMDDNVHMQNTIQFVYELQKAGKQFELMLYPKSRHGVVDPMLLKHMRTAMTNFITANL